MIGGLGVITGVHFIVHGFCTMSFNQVRWAIPVALTFGVVLRCRAMQLQSKHQWAGYVTEESNPSDPLAPLLDDAALPAASM